MLNKLEDVEILDKSKILGEGAFSEVLRVRSKVDGQMYALKTVSLKDRHTKAVEGRSRQLEE